MIKRISNLLYGLKITLLSRFHIVSLNISPHSQIGKGVTAKRGSVISEDVFIGDNVELYRNVLIGKGVRVGDFTSINDATVVECGKIGVFCSIGVGVIIGLGVHPLDHVTTSTLACKALCVNNQSFTPPLSPYY